MYSGHSSLFQEANGERADESMADASARSKLKSHCNGISCLFAKAHNLEMHDGMGAPGQRAIGRGEGDVPGQEHGLSAKDFSSRGTDTHTGMHMGFRLRHLEGPDTANHLPKPHLHGVGQLKATGRGGGGAAAATARAGAGRVGKRISASTPGADMLKDAPATSEIDAGNMVRADEAKDLKRSMSEALTDYKKLLKHEVKMEEGRTLSMPQLSIESPEGKPLLPTLADTPSNPAHLHLSALKNRKPAKTPATGYGASQGGGGQGPEALMNNLLAKAKLNGGPWDQQESSSDVEQAPLTPRPAAPVTIARRAHQAQVAQAAVQAQANAQANARAAAAEASASAAAAAASASAPSAVRGGGGARAAAMPTQPADFAGGRGPTAPRVEQEVPEQREEVRTAVRRAPARNGNTMDVAGMLIHDIGADIGSLV